MNKTNVLNTGLVLLALVCLAFSGFRSTAQTPESTEGPSNPSATGGRAVNAKDALLFRNGDLLYGALESIEPGQSVLWLHPDASEPIEFSPESLSEIQFGPLRESVKHPRSNCRVRLNNQDELEGILRSCDAEKIVLDSWYGGTLEIPRKRVQYIVSLPADFPPIYEGPTGTNGWTIGKVSSAVPNSGEWRYKNGAFYAVQAASIARDVHLPDVASIQFDLAWKGTLFMAIALYTDYLEPINLQDKEKEPDFGGFYSLRLNSYTADLLPITQHEPIRYLGQTAMPGFTHKSQVHVEIRVNKAKRLVALMADGTLLKQWIDTEGFVGEGTALRFVHQGQGSIKMSNIRISEWDGQFEERPSNPPDSKFDLAKLQNGDRLNGRLERIDGGEQMLFAPSDAKPIEVPMDRVRMIEMAGRTLDLPKNEGATARLTFRGGGTLTLKLHRWADGKITGSSPSFGEAVFDASAFERIEFLTSQPSGA